MGARKGISGGKCSPWCAIKAKLDELWNKTHNSYNKLNGIEGDGTQNLILEAGHNMDIVTVDGNHAIIACIPEVPEIPFDEVPTAGSRNAVRSGGVWTADEDIRRSVTAEANTREIADTQLTNRVNNLEINLNSKVSKTGNEQTMDATVYRVTPSSDLVVEGDLRVTGTAQVPDSAVGSTGLQPVNATRLMAEMQQHHLEIDTEMSDTSEDAVQNKVIKAYVDNAPYVKLQSENQTIHSNLEIISAYHVIQSSIVRIAGGTKVELFGYDVTVPDTDTGSTGDNAVNSDRLMAEIADISDDFVKKESASLQTVDSLIAVTKDSKQYLKTWGGSVPSIELGSTNVPVSVPNTTVGMRGAGAVNQTRLMDEIAAIPKDTVVTEGSSNVVTSGAVWTMGNSTQQAITQLQNVVVALDTNKQDKMSANSPVRITADVITLDMDNAPTANSGKPVTSKGLKTQFDNVAQDMTVLGNAINANTLRFGGLKIVGYWNGLIGSDASGGVTKRSGNLTVQNYAAPNIGLYLCSGFNVAYTNRFIMIQQFNANPPAIVSPADSTSANNFQFTCKSTIDGSSIGTQIPIHIIMFAIN